MLYIKNYCHKIEKICNAYHCTSIMFHFFFQLVNKKARRLTQNPVQPKSTALTEVLQG